MSINGFRRAIASINRSTATAVIALNLVTTMAWGLQGEIDMSKFDCQVTVEKKYCLYNPETDPNNLIFRVATVIFENGHPPIASDKRRLQRLDPSSSTISFWHEDPHVLRSMMQLLLDFDKIEKMPLRELIEVTTSVYKTSDAGLSQFSLSLQNAAFKQKQGSDKSVVEKNGGLSTGMFFNSVGMSMAISAGKGNSIIEEVTKVSQLVPNQGRLNYSYLSPIYFSFPTKVIDTQTAGLSISSQCSLTEGPSPDERLIQFQNLSLKYGILDKAAAANLPPGANLQNLQMSPELMYFPLGGSLLISDSRTDIKEKAGGMGLLSFTKSRSQELNRIFIVLSARVITLKDISQQNREAGLNSRPPKYNQQQIDRLPKSRFASIQQDLENVIGKISASYEPAAAGGAFLHIKLDETLATAENITEPLTINIRQKNNKRVDSSVTKEVQSLMIGSAAFPFASIQLKKEQTAEFVVTITSPKYKMSRRFNLLHFADRLDVIESK